MYQGRQIGMRPSSLAVWFRRSSALAGVLLVAGAVLFVSFYIDRLAVTVTAAALGVCLLYAVFGSFRLEDLTEALAFATTFVALLLLGLVAFASGREGWAMLLFAGMVPVGLGIVRIIAQNVSAASRRHSDRRRESPR